VAIWRETTGDVLAFLPGVGDIARTAEQLGDRPCCRSTAISPEQQDRAVAIRRAA
jgi:HrpA-like RNA helicase